MKSKIKQLLVGVLAVAVISSNFVAALIPNAATITGTIAVTENKTVVASTTDTTVDVPVKVTFTEAVTGPHGRFSITADGATLTNVKVDSFDNANAEENPDAYVRIGDEYGDDGTNLETGTILVESAIDNKAAVVTYINLVATFTVPANTAAGTVIPVTVKGIDTTNANEDNWEDLVATNGKITVHGAGTTYGYNETNHWLACAVSGCTEHKYNETAHTMSDYVASEDGTTETATCSANCGYSHTKDVEVVEPEVTYINWQDITYDFSTDTVHVPFTITSDFYTVLKDASAAGNRQRNLVVTIGSKEYDFGDQKIYDGSNDTTVGGFNITKLNTEVTVKFNVTWTGGEMTTNIYTFVIADELEQQYEKSLLSSTEYMDLDLLGKFVDYNNAYKAALEVSGSEAISYEASDFVTENEAYLDFSTGYVDLETNTFAISFTITDDFYTVLKNASAAGNRQRNLYIEVDGKTYALGDQKITDATNNTTLSGFSAAKLDGTFKVYYNITWTGGEMTTNAITVDIPTVLANGSSDLAVAYSAFNDAKLAFNA